MTYPSFLLTSALFFLYYIFTHKPQCICIYNIMHSEKEKSCLVVVQEKIFTNLLCIITTYENLN